MAKKEEATKTKVKVPTAKKVTKQELIELIADKSGISKNNVSETIDTMIDVLRTKLRKDYTVVIKGFGKFRITHRAARVGRNPQTGEKVKIAARDSAKFSFSKDFLGLGK